MSDTQARIVVLNSKIKSYQRDSVVWLVVFVLETMALLMYPVANSISPSSTLGSVLLTILAVLLIPYALVMSVKAHTDAAVLRGQRMHYEFELESESKG